MTDKKPRLIAAGGWCAPAASTYPIIPLPGPLFEGDLFQVPRTGLAWGDMKLGSIKPPVEPKTEGGHWTYAVRVTDEDGDQMIWTSHSSYGHEPFTSAEDARDFASGWMENFEVIRSWVPDPVWEVVNEGES